MAIYVDDYRPFSILGFLVQASEGMTLLCKDVILLLQHIMKAILKGAQSIHLYSKTPTCRQPWLTMANHGRPSDKMQSVPQVLAQGKDGDAA